MISSTNELDLKLAEIESSIVRIKQNLKSINGTLKSKLNPDNKNYFLKMKERLNLELVELENRRQNLRLVSLKNNCDSLLSDLKSTKY